MKRQMFHIPSIYPAKAAAQTKRCLLLLAFLAALTPLAAQTPVDTRANPYAFQYGFSLKASIELGISKHAPAPVYRLVASTGVASNFLKSSLHPSLNTELQLYNGGLGSRNQRFTFKPTFDFITSVMLTAGDKNFLYSRNQPFVETRMVPLYYFGDFVIPPLQNPFRNSVSVGTNFIFTSDKSKKNQRVGFVNVHLNRFQISYYNDGGIGISHTRIGDRKDRYYTGGAVVSYHGQPHTVASLVEVSYHKHTGYTLNAFELSNKMYLAYMNYRDPVQEDYNKSVWSLTVTNVAQHYGASIKGYNYVRVDAQHWIHWTLFDSFHLVPYQPHLSLSGHFNRGNTTLGLR
ncbi:hypothetical protein H9Q13_06645 [Pontibacter sp. JH31]|uniref:Bacterial toxin 23 domain-containing protein n=1 Tax=Pontibacter aquaedesilientis TaxID=2766980 RepID=A0ABR7XEZ4_9BACT|nr:polymorphic toxin type 23 domain-containing protein [Pontibacter aquaedesilientis]MBD1396837.1 hypothetical protein [Pontibacter aquaedesilientis]